MAALSTQKCFLHASALNITTKSHFCQLVYRTAPAILVSPSSRHVNISKYKSSETSSLSKPLVKRTLAAQKRRTLAVGVTELSDKFKMEWPKITLFGDSITRRSTDVENGCWGSMIDYKIGAYFDLDTRGFEGYNTKWGLELMPKLFPRSYLEKVEIFIQFFGHNDSWEPTIPMHVPPEDYEANVRKMVKYLLDNGLKKTQIILITPTWYHRDQFLEYLKESNLPPFGKTFEDAKKYCEAVLSVARDESIDVVDFFGISAKHEPLKEMFCDGVHFSRTGAKMLFEQLMPIIERKIESSHKKPLADLWHSIPIDQHPEVKPMLEAHIDSLKNAQ